jgi:hypothetical protein
MNVIFQNFKYLHIEVILNDKVIVTIWGRFAYLKYSLILIKGVLKKGLKM